MCPKQAAYPGRGRVSFRGSKVHHPDLAVTWFAAGVLRDFQDAPGEFVQLSLNLWV
jgi:hypothetical protein